MDQIQCCFTGQEKIAKWPIYFLSVYLLKGINRRRHAKIVKEETLPDFAKILHEP